MRTTNNGRLCCLCVMVIYGLVRDGAVNGWKWLCLTVKQVIPPHFLPCRESMCTSVECNY